VNENNNKMQQENEFKINQLISKEKLLIKKENKINCSKDCK
jgi:hypothetical protein